MANLSLGSDGIDTAVDGAVTKMIKAGITVVLAAGNGDKNGKGISACTVSPAHVKAAITVGATTSTDKRTTFSNYGACVDLFAPGYNIKSTYIMDKTGNWQWPCCPAPRWRLRTSPGPWPCTCSVTPRPPRRPCRPPC